MQNLTFSWVLLTPFKDAKVLNNQKYMTMITGQDDDHGDFGYWCDICYLRGKYERQQGVYLYLLGKRTYQSQIQMGIINTSLYLVVDKNPLWRKSEEQQEA